MEYCFLRESLLSPSWNNFSIHNIVTIDDSVENNRYLNDTAVGQAQRKSEELKAGRRYGAGCILQPALIFLFIQNYKFIQHQLQNHFGEIGFGDHIVGRKQGEQGVGIYF